MPRMRSRKARSDDVGLGGASGAWWGYLELGVVKWGQGELGGAMMPRRAG
jgi:hypothetical protein